MLTVLQCSHRLAVDQHIHPAWENRRIFFNEGTRVNRFSMLCSEIKWTSCDIRERMRNIHPFYWFSGIVWVWFPTNSCWNPFMYLVVDKDYLPKYFCELCDFNVPHISWSSGNDHCWCLYKEHHHMQTRYSTSIPWEWVTLTQPFFILLFLSDDVIRAPGLWLATAAAHCAFKALPYFCWASATAQWDWLHSQKSCLLHPGLYWSLEPTGFPKAVSPLSAPCTVVQIHRWVSDRITHFLWIVWPLFDIQLSYVTEKSGDIIWLLSVKKYYFQEEKNEALQWCLQCSSPCVRRLWPHCQHTHIYTDTYMEVRDHNEQSSETETAIQMTV